VHSHDVLQWQPVVHHREYSLLHLTTIPCTCDHCSLLFNVKDDSHFTVKTHLLVLRVGHLAGIDDGEAAVTRELKMCDNAGTNDVICVTIRAMAYSEQGNEDAVLLLIERTVKS
jgi:hypothetical protein